MMDKASKSSLPPGKSGLPFIGETIDFLSDRNFASKRQAKYGSIFRTNVFGRHTVIMSGSEANHFLLTNETKYFVSALPTSTQKLLGANSLSNQYGEFHTARRKLLFQAFQPRALVSYLPTIVEITEQYLARWEKIGTFAWYPELKHYTLAIACKLFMGVDLVERPQIGEFFENWCEGLFSVPVSLPWTTFGKALKSRKKLLKELETIILERQKKGHSETDALGILLNATDEHGNKLSLAELKDQILLLLFAGHETLTSALASFCLLMCQYPEVLSQIRQEQQQLNSSPPLTLDKLKQMTYLEQVLKEVLRFIPPVGGGFREVIQNCEFKGYFLPKGWAVQYQIARTHKDNTIYPQPEQFEPERFSLSRAEDKQQAFGYVPFGGGIRECLGKEFARLEMKILASLLVQNYTWELLPDQDLSLITIPTPRPRDGLKVKFSQAN